MNHKLIDTVRQIDAEPIEVRHNTGEGGTEWLTLEQGGDAVRVTLAGLPDLIRHLQKLKDFYGCPLNESPSYWVGATGRW
jgi:hypothetical protein